MNKNAHKLKLEIDAAIRNEPGIFAVAVIDLPTGRELVADSRPMRSASLIKLFIMAEAFAGLTAGSLHPAETIAFSEADRVGGAGLLQHLPAGTCRTVLELIDLMITESDNIATNLLIDRMGMDSINERSLKLGCNETILRRHMMDFAAASDGKENFTSATDTARILQQIFQNRCVSVAADHSMREILGRQTDRCKLPFFLPQGTLCQHKTGELPGAEHDAGIVFSPGGPYVLAILSDGLPDQERGRLLIARLSRLVFDYFASVEAL